MSTLEANSNTEVNNVGTNINDDKNKVLAKAKHKFSKIEGLFDHPSEDISIAGMKITLLLTFSWKIYIICEQLISFLTFTIFVQFEEVIWFFFHCNS